MTKHTVPAYELRVTLDHVEPPIWRTFLIPADAGLDDLHHVLQVVMGWTNSHLHEFIKGRSRYGVPDPDGDDFGSKLHPEHEHGVAELLTKPKQKITYSYDFGDGWEHTVTLVAIHPAAIPAPKCLDGARACPPDDCGGPGGYEDLLRVLADRSDPEHRSMLKWFKSMTPKGHDPEVFPIAAVNKQLAKGLDLLAKEFGAAEDGA